MEELNKLKYPIGKFSFQSDIAPSGINECKKALEELPKKLREAVQSLNDQQLDTPYREGGWTVRQVVHHIADSHLNSYIRFKLALTEDHPTIKPYDENAWVKLKDSEMPVDVSLQLLESVHQRMMVVLNNLQPGDLERKVFHPESKRDMSVSFLLQLYAWHGKHHTAHVTSLRKRMNW